MRSVFNACRRHLRDRPVAVRLFAVAAAAVLAGAALAAAGLTLLAQLIGGLALVPLTLASYRMLLPAQLWADEGNGGGWHDGDNPEGPSPVPSPGGAVDWPQFERQFWSYVEEREPTRA